MKSDLDHQVQAAEVVLPCPDLNNTLPFFTETLQFRVDTIFPADNPSVAVISGYGLRIRLEQDGTGEPGVIRLLCRDPAAVADGATELVAPNGTRIQFVESDPPLVLPPEKQSFVLSRLSEDAQWVEGRAGMCYRDIIPDQQGGRFVASHIHMPDGGPVPDYVHFHKVRFQMIYCYKGWVKVAYEDQGPPITMLAGDCVLQPPLIRHRALESSSGLQVIEVSCPALHETFADHDLELPTPTIKKDRDFGGQRFVFHQAADAEWRPWRIEGFEFRDTGIASATDGLAGVRVARPSGEVQPEVVSHSGKFLFIFVLAGKTTLLSDEHGAQQMAAGDSCVVPSGTHHALTDCSDDLEMLEVTLPASLETTHDSVSFQMLLE